MVDAIEQNTGCGGQGIVSWGTADRVTGFEMANTRFDRVLVELAKIVHHQGPIQNIGRRL